MSKPTPRLMRPRPSRRPRIPLELQIADSMVRGRQRHGGFRRRGCRTPTRPLEEKIRFISSRGQGRWRQRHLRRGHRNLRRAARFHFYYYSYVAGSTADSSANSTEVVKPATVGVLHHDARGFVEAMTRSWLMCTLCRDGRDRYSVRRQGVHRHGIGVRVAGWRHARVDVVLFDQDGKIEGGYQDWKPTPSLVRRPTTTSAVGAPQYASYAVYASSWPEEDAA